MGKQRKDTITDDMLDDMIEDLKEDWDESSLQSGYLHNHAVDLDNRRISTITVKDLKYIIRDIVREELSYSTTPRYVPYTQPYYVTPNTYEQPWWRTGPTCKTETTAQPLYYKKEQIND